MSAAAQYIAPKIFLPYQIRYINDRSPLRLIEKSRRIGLSWALAAECVLDACVANGVNVYYVNYNKDGAKAFIEDCAWWARAFNAVAGAVQQTLFEDPDNPDAGILTFSLKFASGKSIQALSSRPANLRGKKGRIVIDEAAYHHGLDDLLASAMGIVQWREPRARIDVVSTHAGIDNPFNQLVEATRAKDTRFSLHRATFTQAIADGYFKRICLKNRTTWTPQLEADFIADTRKDYRDRADEELECVPSMSGDSYFQLDTIDACMVPGAVERLTLENAFKHWKADVRSTFVDNWLTEEIAPLIKHLPKLPHFFGMDFGRKADRSVMVPGYLTEKMQRVAPFVIELLNVPYDQQRQIMEWLLKRLPKLYAAAFDANGNGQALAEYAAQRYSAYDPKTEKGIVEEVNINGPFYDSAFPLLRAQIEKQGWVMPEWRDHQSDFMHVKRVKGMPRIPETKNESSDGPPRHGDAAVAYLLADHASRKPQLGYGYETPKKEEHGLLPGGGLRSRPDEEQERATATRGRSRGGVF